jgi:hypothetical protein
MGLYISSPWNICPGVQVVSLHASLLLSGKGAAACVLFLRQQQAQSWAECWLFTPNKQAFEVWQPCRAAIIQVCVCVCVPTLDGV